MNVFDLYAKIGLDSTGYETGLSDAKSLAETVGGGITGIFSRAASLVSDAMSAAGGAVKAFTADAVRTGMDFDKSMSQVAATMGTTTDQIGELRDFAREMGSQTKYSATEAADALNFMALAGYDAETSMSMLPNVLNLASAGNFALARASDMVTDTQTAFGISLERTTQLVDEMAKAASTGNTSVEQLGDAFLTVGGLAKELNGGFVTLDDGTTAAVDGVQELEIALTAMANAGIKGSEAGTHMRNMLLKLASPTEDGVLAFKELGVEIFDNTGKMKSLSDIFGTLSKSLTRLNNQDLKLKYISAMFNSRDTAAVEALLAAMGNDWDNIGESILNAAGAAEQMSNEQLNNLAGDVDILKSTFDELKISVSDIVTPALRKFTESGTAALGNLAKAVKSYGIKEGIEQWFDLESIIYTKKWEKIYPEIKAFGESVVTNLKNGIEENAESAGSAVPEILTKFGEKLTDTSAFDRVAGFASTVVTNFADGMLSKESLDKLADEEHGIPKFMENLCTNITNATEKLTDAASHTVSNFAEYLNDADNTKKMQDAASKMLVTLGKAFVDNSLILYKFAVNLCEAFIEMFVGYWNSFWENGALSGLIRAAREEITGQSAEEHFAEIEAAQSDYSTMDGMTNWWDGTQDGDDVPAAGWNEWQKYNENRQIARFDIAEPVRNTALSSGGENLSISFGDIHVSGGQDAGEEVIRQIDRALRQLQTRQQRGIGGTAWQF